ncbi:MAG: ATP-binding protein, partial [Desulfobulbaceae bacterium]|nr:ATP-binding protein [Desulfobulbaceae bacterium]
MNAGAGNVNISSLRPEWTRIEILADCLGRERVGECVSDERLVRLKELLAEVEQLRQAPESPWQVLLGANWQPLAYDLLAMALAPEIEPRIGWLYQQLQSGVPSLYPSVALLRELLALDEIETGAFYWLIDEESPLRRARLLSLEGQHPHQCIVPGQGVVARLMGWPQTTVVPPGATRVRVQARWQDLVLPEECMSQLVEFLYWARERSTVVGEWGGLDCGGPVALFAGPSGTGKTFAAGALANELGWPLYRVDLGALVSKYIGETEKNLNRLFDAAHGQSLVLLFDEADSLFGQRGEIKDARDRYANMEVSHLLARIEAHHGPVILTTNMRQQLDSAFARRFQVVIDFPRPDAAARSLLWSRMLPPNAPNAPDLDPVFIGKAVNMTGGSIRNSALHAA